MSEFTKEQWQLIDRALEHAIDDAEQYLKYGDPESDYAGIEQDLEAYRKVPDQWQELRRVILEKELY